MAEKKDEKTKKGKANKPAAGKPAAKKANAKKATKAESREEAKVEEKPSREEFEAPLDEEAGVAAQEEPEKAPPTEEEGDLSEEEFRRLMEESLETVTVADIVLAMMNQLASVGFMKMGLPETVNLKYRDFAQARLAIDTLEAMIKGTDEKVPAELLQPFKSTLASMQMNFVQLMRGQN